MTKFAESTMEEAAIDWLKDLGYAYAFGPEIAFDGEMRERGDYQEALLLGRLQGTIARINPDIPAQAREEALRKIIRLGKPSLLLNNHAFHHMLVNGIEVDYKRSATVPRAFGGGPVDKAKDGRMVSGRVYVVDFENIENNDWLVVNQVHELPQPQHNRRPDVVVFVNGLPLAVIELKNAADENAMIWLAFNQLQTYKHDIPALFHYNELLIISDGLNTRIGSLTGNKEWFPPWKIRLSWSLPTAMTLMINSSTPSHAALKRCVRCPSKPQAAKTCRKSSKGASRAVSSLRPFKSFCLPEGRFMNRPYFQIAATSS